MAARSAIVTGGAGGLGAATVRRLVELGFAVVVFDQSSTRAEALVEDLGSTTVAATGDVNDDDAVGAAIDAARALGPLSVLVNVAGGGVGGGPTVTDDGAPHAMAGFISTMEINAFGTFNAARLVAAAMGANEPDDDGQRGVIVNTASIAGYEGQRGQVAYAAAKAAILGMTLPMARDLAPTGVRVCGIAPGPMGTPIMLRVMDKLDEDPTDGLVFPPRRGEPREFALHVGSIVATAYLKEYSGKDVTAEYDAA